MGRGPLPKPDGARRRRNQPVHQWKATEGEGWQHGELPKPPAGLLKASREAWDIWMRAWFAAHWLPEDLPGLQHVIRLYDRVQRGEFQRSSELRLLLDTYGITPKGQQDRRWKPPEAPKAERAPLVAVPDHWRRGDDPRRLLADP